MDKFLRIALSACVIVMSGCAAALVAGGIGAGVGTAVYVTGSLKEHVEHPPEEVRVATVKGFEDLGMPIIRNVGDSLTGEVKSEFSDEKSVKVDLESVGENMTEVTIRVGTFGDEVRSRRVMYAIKNHLE